MEARNVLTQGTYNDDGSRAYRNKFYSKGGNDMDTVKIHELKTDPEPYDSLVEGHKTNTVRKDDRKYAEGDYIIFRKTKYTGEQMKNNVHTGIDRMPLVYMGVSVLCKITHVHDGPGMMDGWVACSVKIIDRYPGRVG